MLIDTNTRTILIRDLKFTPDHVRGLEQNAALLSSALGLIELLRRRPGQREVKEFAINQIKRIRISLNKAPFANNKRLQQARADFYSFKRMLR